MFSCTVIKRSLIHLNKNLKSTKNFKSHGTKPTSDKVKKLLNEKSEIKSLTVQEYIQKYGLTKDSLTKYSEIDSLSQEEKNINEVKYSKLNRDKNLSLKKSLNIQNEKHTWKSKVETIQFKKPEIKENNNEDADKSHFWNKLTSNKSIDRISLLTHEEAEYMSTSEYDKGAIVNFWKSAENLPLRVEISKDEKERTYRLVNDPKIKQIISKYGLNTETLSENENKYFNDGRPKNAMTEDKYIELDFDTDNNDNTKTYINKVNDKVIQNENLLSVINNKNKVTSSISSITDMLSNLDNNILPSHNEFTELMIQYKNESNISESQNLYLLHRACYQRPSKEIVELLLDTVLNATKQLGKKKSHLEVRPLGSTLKEDLYNSFDLVSTLRAYTTEFQNRKYIPLSSIELARVMNAYIYIGTPERALVLFQDQRPYMIPGREQLDSALAAAAMISKPELTLNYRDDIIFSGYPITLENELNIIKVCLEYSSIDSYLETTARECLVKIMQELEFQYGPALYIMLGAAKGDRDMVSISIKDCEENIAKQVSSLLINGSWDISKLIKSEENISSIPLQLSARFRTSKQSLKKPLEMNIINSTIEESGNVLVTMKNAGHVSENFVIKELASIYGLAASQSFAYKEYFTDLISLTNEKGIYVDMTWKANIFTSAVQSKSDDVATTILINLQELNFKESTEILQLLPILLNRLCKNDLILAKKAITAISDWQGIDISLNDIYNWTETKPQLKKMLMNIHKKLEKRSLGKSWAATFSELEAEAREITPWRKPWRLKQSSFM